MPATLIFLGVIAAWLLADYVWKTSPSYKAKRQAQAKRREEYAREYDRLHPRPPMPPYESYSEGMARITGKHYLSRDHTTTMYENPYDPTDWGSEAGKRAANAGSDDGD